jgi:hypothetical protein
VPTIVQLPTGDARSVRNHGIGVGKTAERLGEARPPAAVLSWLAWCREGDHDAPAVPTRAKRLAVPGSETPARSRW